MIVDCFSYFFGMESIKKYLAKKTIVVESVVETDDIPIPCFTLRKYSPKNCWPDCRVDGDVLEYADNSSFHINEILNVNEDDKWKKHFQSVDQKIIYMLKPTTNLTSKLSTTYSLSFNSTYLIYASSISSENEIFFENGVFFPEILLYDSKYRRMIPKLVNIPELILETGKFVQGTEHYIYLKVRKITKLNHVNRPCEEDPN